jgi:hypothetical protein
MEIKEDGKETNSDEQEQYEIEIQSNSLCSMFETPNYNPQNANEDLLEIKNTEVKDRRQFEKNNYAKKDTLEPKSRWSDNNQSQSIMATDELKKQQRNVTKFKGFGDFFPQDFMKDFDENTPTEIGIKNYLEKQRLQCKMLNCREEEIRELNKKSGPDVQSWLHFFG